MQAALFKELETYDHGNGFLTLYEKKTPTPVTIIIESNQIAQNINLKSFFQILYVQFKVNIISFSSLEIKTGSVNGFLHVQNDPCTFFILIK